MIINKIGNLSQYQFEGTEDRLGLNIYVFEMNGEAIMFDTGYEENFLEVQEDLSKKGIKIEKLILTHFHPDHTGGIKHLRDIEIYGSYKAEETLSSFYEDYQELLPNQIITEKTEIEFHGETIKMIPNPSHSECTMIIKLQKFVFAADDVMFFDDEKQCIPYCATKVATHLDGLTKLRKMAEGNWILPNHGRMLKCTLYFKFAIMYFKHILKHPDCSYEDFSKLYKIEFRNSHWHEINLKQV